MNEEEIKALNDYLLRAISAYDSHVDGRHFDIPLEDRNVDFYATLRQLRLLQSSVELRLDLMGTEK